MKKHLGMILTAAVAALLLGACGSADTAPESTAAPAEPIPVILGTLENGTYENEYLGFGAQFPAGWQVDTAENLQDFSESVKEKFKDSDDKELGMALAEYPQIMDMKAINPETGDSVNVMYTELSETERVTFLSMDEDQILDSVLDQKNAIMSTYAKAGMTTESMEKVTITFLGQQRQAIRTVCKMKEDSIYMYQIFDYTLGGQHGVVTTFSGVNDETLKESIALFYALD